MAHDAVERGTIAFQGLDAYARAVADERARAFTASLDRCAPADGPPTENEARGWDRPTVRTCDRRGRVVYRATLREAYRRLPVKARAVIEAGRGGAK
jgi:hypothetical protein